MTTMTSWLQTYKPAASRRLQLTLAATVWAGVGAILACVGIYWVFDGGDGSRAMLSLTVAAFLGIGKSFLVLDRTTNRIVQRIEQRGDGYCLGGFLSWRVWAMVLGMMLLGRLLRSTPMPRAILGLIYAAVGIGLLLSSRSIWKALKNHR
jgi:membrane-associated PAP2 superfamily phosphatase